MKALGWGLILVVMALLVGIVGEGDTSWLVLVAVGTVFLAGLAMALGSNGIVLARRLGYMIRTVRSAAKGEPEPPPPAPDLMQTMAKPMKAVPMPPLPPPKEDL